LASQGLGNWRLLDALGRDPRPWTFPGDVATLSLPVRSRWGIGGQLIEFHGIEPHVEVEAVPEDLLRGLNTEILKAEQYILASPG